MSKERKGVPVFWIKVLGQTLLALAILAILGVTLSVVLFTGILPYAFIAGIAGGIADLRTVNKPRLYVVGMILVVFLGGTLTSSLTMLILAGTHPLSSPWLILPALVLGIVAAIVSAFAYYFAREDRLAIEAFQRGVREAKAKSCPQVS